MSALTRRELSLSPSADRLISAKLSLSLSTAIVISGF